MTSMPPSLRTIEFEPSLIEALEEKAAAYGATVSALVNDAVRAAIDEDEEDLAALVAVSAEKSRSFEEVVAEMKSRGRL